MWASFTLIAASVALASCSPISARLSLPGDTVNDMQSVINGQQPCADVAAIFARGTFDDGNIGVWVGPDLINSLRANLSSFAGQGVDPNAYPANLADYVNEGGSNQGSASMANTTQAYVQKCPKSVVVLAGWSQGALVAHKALAQLDNATRTNVAGLVTFGDPWHLFSNASDPIASSQFQSECITGTDLDPLCASLPQDFKFPTSLSDIIGPFKNLPSLTQGAEQGIAAASLVVEFPGQLAQAAGGVLGDLTSGEWLRLMLTPQHFTYGNNGMAASAANFIVDLPAVKALNG